jgi:hypothetical protein
MSLGIVWYQEYVTIMTSFQIEIYHIRHCCHQLSGVYECLSLRIVGLLRYKMSATSKHTILYFSIQNPSDTSGVLEKANYEAKIKKSQIYE